MDFNGLIQARVKSEERKHIDFFARDIENNKIEFCPRNLFTTLLLVGVYVPYEEVKDKRMYEDENGTRYSYSDDGDIFVKPSKPLEYIEFDFSITPDGVVNV